MVERGRQGRSKVDFWRRSAVDILIYNVMFQSTLRNTSTQTLHAELSHRMNYADYITHLDVVRFIDVIILASKVLQLDSEATSQSKPGGSNVHGNPSRLGCMPSYQLQERHAMITADGRETLERVRLHTDSVPQVSRVPITIWMGVACVGARVQVVVLRGYG